MLYFRHNTQARHDPFIRDLTREFGPLGYSVYFKTLEVYCKEFKPVPGWFLNISTRFFKEEVGVYHMSKLQKICDFITSWGGDLCEIHERFGTDAGEISERLWLDTPQSFGNLSTIYQKWFVNLREKSTSIFIPNVLKILDEYTIKRLRQYEKMSGQCPDNVRQQASKQVKKRTAETAKPDKTAEAAAEKIMIALSEKSLAVQKASRQRGGNFSSGAFVIKYLKSGYHPQAVIDGLCFLLKCWRGSTPVNDDWALALSTVKSSHQKYGAVVFDVELFISRYGPFITNDLKSKSPPQVLQSIGG